MLTSSVAETCSPYHQEIASLNPGDATAGGSREQNWCLQGGVSYTLSPVNSTILANHGIVNHALLKVFDRSSRENL